MGADRNGEVELVIELVGFGAAQVPGEAGTAHHHAGEAPGVDVVLGDDADVDRALLEDPVLGDDRVEIVEELGELVRPGLDIVEQVRRQVLVDAARADVVGVQPRATGPVVEFHQLLALDIAPERRAQRADVDGQRHHVEQVVQDPPDLHVEHADQRGAARHLGAGELFDGQAEGMFLVHRRDVVEPVEIGDVLQVGAALHQLFGAAVEKADMRVGALDDLAVELEHQTQHTVGGGVLGAEIDVEIADLLLAGLGVVEAAGVVAVAVHHFLASPFSSPGSTYFAPSQGDMKSNWRYSCTSETGS